MTVVGWAQDLYTSPVTFTCVEGGDINNVNLTSLSKAPITFSISGWYGVDKANMRFQKDAVFTFLSANGYKITKVIINANGGDGKTENEFTSTTIDVSNEKVSFSVLSWSDNKVEIKHTTKVTARTTGMTVYYTNAEPVAVTSCTISPSEKTTVGVGKSFKLTASTNGTNPEYNWYKTTSLTGPTDVKESIGTDPIYEPTLSEIGSYFYYCVAENTTKGEDGKDKLNKAISNIVEVTVVKNDITLSSSDMNMSIGDAAKPIEVTAKDGEEVINGLAYTYESDNPNVATVDESGNVTPVAVGEATITVSFAGNETYNGATTTLRVVVTAAPVVAEPIFDVRDENENQVLDFETNPSDLEKLRLRFSIPEGLADASNCIVKYSLNGGTPNTEYKGEYLVLTSTTFINAVIYNKSKKKNVGEVVQKVVRFNFTLLRAFSQENVDVVPGTQYNITTADNNIDGRPYVIVTFGSKGDDQKKKTTYTINGKDVTKECGVWIPTTIDGTMNSSEISGFNYVARGNFDAEGESKKQFDGSKQYNPNKEGYDSYREESVDNGTFKIPVSGAYIKFEPKQGGTINVILRQNGIIANDDKEDLTVMRTRPIYVCDENGTIIEDVKAMINSNSKMNEKIFDNWKVGQNFSDNTGNNPISVDQSNRNFKLYRQLVYQAANPSCSLTRAEDGTTTLTNEDGTEVADETTCDFWTNNAKTDVTKNILYKDGNGWITMSKAYVRYSFDVKPGKTYFIMGHVTKIGACGYSFKRLIKDDKMWAEIVNNRTITINENSNELPASIVPEPNTKISGCNVTLNRTFDRGVWTSLVLPFSVSPYTLEKIFGEGTQVLHFGKVDGSKLNLVKHFHQMIVAGTPVLIKPAGEYNTSNKITNPVFENITYTGYVPIKEMTGGNWKITGSYIPKDMPANSYYIGYKADGTGNNIYLSTKGRKMNGTRAWFEYIGEDTFSKLTGLSINGVEDGTPTDIGSILTDAENANVMNGNVYNLNGQIVSRNGIDGLAKGIYVTNGKKIIVK